MHTYIKGTLSFDFTPHGHHYVICNIPVEYYYFK